MTLISAQRLTVALTIQENMVVKFYTPPICVLVQTTGLVMKSSSRIEYEHTAINPWWVKSIILKEKKREKKYVEVIIL